MKKVLAISIFTAFFATQLSYAKGSNGIVGNFSYQDIQVEDTDGSGMTLGGVFNFHFTRANGGPSIFFDVGGRYNLLNFDDGNTDGNLSGIMFVLGGGFSFHLSSKLILQLSLLFEKSLSADVEIKTGSTTHNSSVESYFARQHDWRLLHPLTRKIRLGGGVTFTTGEFEYSLNNKTFNTDFRGYSLNALLMYLL